MSELKYIETEVKGDTAKLWLNRPEKGNALSPGMIREFTEVFREWGKNSQLRFVIIGGRGNNFCTGADLNWLAASANLSEEDNLRESLELASFFEAVWYSDKICIARVQGACYGGGVGLAAVSDFVFAEESARFSFGEIRLGLVPATIAPFVINRTGSIRAKQFMLTGQVLQADEAKAIGLVDEVQASSGISEGIDSLLEDLRKGSPAAQREIKSLLNGLHHEAYSDRIRQRTSESIARARVSEDGKEGIRAFLEKREPKWREE